MPAPSRKIDYPLFVHSALETFANSANELFLESNVMMRVVRIGNVITIYVNQKAVCKVTVEGS